jgi:hypothetical protein
VSAPRGRAGLTIVEVAIALGVLSVLVSGLFSSLMTTLRTDVAVEERRAASATASRELDRVLADPGLAFVSAVSYFDVQRETGRVAAAGQNLLASAAPLPAGWTQARAGRIEVVRDPGGLGPDLLRITVSVRWRAADLTTQQLDLVAMRTR